MDSIQISVLTTVKNGEHYLYQMLDSVRNQTFSAFEHIVVDDGSTDNTLNILNEFKNNFPDYPLIILRAQLGRARALNFGVEHSNSKLIAILDGDDLWHPRKLEIQYKEFVERDLDVIATSTIIFENDEQVVFDELRDNRLECFSLKDLLRSNKLSHSSILMKKELCIYDESRKSQFDYELWLRLASAGARISKIHLPLSFHRIHPNQTFESKMKKAYRWRAYKLKFKVALNNHDYFAAALGSIKFVFDMLLPRSIRFKFRELIYKKQV